VIKIQCCRGDHATAVVEITALFQVNKIFNVMSTNSNKTINVLGVVSTDFIRTT